MEKEEDSSDGSGSSSSSDSKSEDHYGVIHEDHSKAGMNNLHYSMSKATEKLPHFSYVKTVGVDYKINCT